jgi:hypothetical protein
MENMNEKKKLEFEKALELRNFEIDNFWKRGWFFGALLVALITGYVTLKNGPLYNFAIYIAFIAFLVSFAQCLMNRGSKYWQERYEYFTKNRESALGIDVTKMQKYENKERYYIDASIRAKDENILARSNRFSVSKLTILVWDTITIFFLFLWLNEVFNFVLCLGVIKFVQYIMIALFHVIIIIYILIFWKKGDIFQNLLKSKDNDDGKDNEKNRYFKDMQKYVNDNIGD